MEKRVSHNVIWDFLDDMPIERDDFNNAVIAKQFFNFNNSNNWDPNEIIIDKTEVKICYSAEMYSKEDVLANEILVEFKSVPNWEEMGFEEEPFWATLIMTLKADNNENFPALELLYKLHDQLFNKDGDSHIYLDGLEINENPKKKYDYLMHFDFG
ncbi:hypothetical protein [Myroides odoratimimus]|uniref:hypothetical protein n=1 Tax=Myroides odoratimimus TaxID=76832 RepID=UPI002575495F|nr:hypothetical protein [Myroides odoratimimus]MDM1450861.1 hypothetical protein [Myroides odoratimimus]